MITKDYILTSKQSMNRSIHLSYTSEGLLHQCTFEGDLTAGQLVTAKKMVPIVESDLNTVAREFNLSLKAVVTEVTFDMFYDTYGHKVGKKEAFTRWKRMPKEQQLKAYLYIDKYKNSLKLQPGVAMMYPATYLNKERWND